MADTDRELRIMLKLLADTAGATQVRAQLTALQREQENLGKQVNAAASTELSTTQATAAAQQTLNTIMERRVIMETQLEAAEARIAGNTTLAARLEREAAIRAQALTVQRALNVSTEESIVLAERMVIAQEATAVAAGGFGINISKARAEALQLGKELATGGNTTRTLGALIGSLGTAFTIAGIAGFEVYQGIKAANDSAEETRKTVQKIADESQHVAQEWGDATQQVRKFGDEVKLADKIRAELAKMSTELAEFQGKELTNWQQFWDAAITRPLALLNPALALIKIGNAPFAGALADEKARRAGKLQPPG
jgi:hypothetical protein